MKIYYAYRLTCTHPASPHLYYYGVRTCVGHPQDDDYWSSSKLVRASIALYGKTTFRKKIVAVYPTKDEALAMEIKLHAYFNVKDHPAFFNKANQTSTKFTTPAGMILSPEARAKIGEANRQRGPISNATREKIAAARRGMILSPEARAKVGEARRGKSHALETKVRLAEAQRGKALSAETKAKIAAAARRRYAQMSPAERVLSEAARQKIAVAQRGKTLSDETKAKIAATQRARWATIRSVRAPQGSVGAP